MAICVKMRPGHCMAHSPVPPLSQLLPLIRDLVLLRRGPQDLPYSPALLALLVGATLVLDAVLAEHIVQVGLARMAFSLLPVLALTWLALRIGEKSARFVQAATSAVAAGLVLTLLAIPVLLGIGTLPADPKQLTRAQSLFVLLALLFQVWDLAVVGHILRHALDLKLRLGVLVAVVIYAVDLVAGAALFEKAAS
jgi:hypothetical protein